MRELAGFKLKGTNKKPLTHFLIAFKAEVDTEKAEVLTLKPVVATGCAKHGNVNAGAIFFDGC
ncbi:MAG: hypothetical protein ACYTX0_41740, partial [Nostoc sp.]